MAAVADNGVPDTPLGPGPSGRRPRRGLVLGAGGILGGTWAVGALAALEEVEGWDPRTADVIIGTSAGSLIAAFLGAGVSTATLVAHQRREPLAEHGELHGLLIDEWDAPARPPMPRPTMGSPTLLRNSLLRPGSVRPLAALSAMVPAGSGSLTMVEEAVEAIAPGADWVTHRATWIVAMDYESGQRVVLGRTGAPHVPLPLAVRASCSIPGWFSPVEFEGRRYVDGATHSECNLDLLGPGHWVGEPLDEVVVLSPMASLQLDRPRTMLGRLERQWRRVVTRKLMKEAESVRSGGTEVTVITPGAADLAVIGANLMDHARRVAVLDTAIDTTREALLGRGSSALRAAPPTDERLAEF